MRLYFLIASIFILLSCSNEERNQSSYADKVSELEETVAQLRGKIITLQSELEKKSIDGYDKAIWVVPSSPETKVGEEIEISILYVVRHNINPEYANVSLSYKEKELDSTVLTYENSNYLTYKFKPTEKGNYVLKGILVSPEMENEIKEFPFEFEFTAE